MKIQIISDLHLEFDNPPVLENAGADVLVLGGDIFLAEYFYRNPRFITKPNGTVVDASTMQNNGGYGNDVKQWREFLQHVNDSWANTVYLMGNHEHYKGRWDRNEPVLREELEHYPNIHLLERGRLVIDDVQFLGGTLWTDMNNRDPLTMLSARDLMNDYRAVSDLTSGSYRKLHVNTTVECHEQTRDWIKAMLSEHQMKTVVCTHHTPSRQSLHHRFASQLHMNGCFVNNLDDIMLDNEHLVLWTHGHVHDPWDYTVNRCRVVCNPRGYPGEHTRSTFNPNLVIEV
jgi:Icc-related predicted phosphoesterase